MIGYNGQITVSAISCREMMPDPEFYCDCLTEAFEDLKKAAMRPAKKSKAKGSKKRRTKTNGSGRGKSNGSKQATDDQKPARKKTTRKRASTRTEK